MKFDRPMKKVVQKAVLPAPQPIPHFEASSEACRLICQDGRTFRELFPPSTPQMHFRVPQWPLRYQSMTLWVWRHGHWFSFMSANVNMWVGQRLSRPSLWPQRENTCLQKPLLFQNSKGQMHACVDQLCLPPPNTHTKTLSWNGCWPRGHLEGKVIPTGLPCEGYSMGGRRLRGEEGIRELARGGNSHLEIIGNPKSAPWEKITAFDMKYLGDTGARL